MKFDDLDAQLRVYETADDRCVPPGFFMVVRLDGRNFTRLTKEVWNLKAPFDERFRDIMIETAGHLMDCGFAVTYGYTQSDEISLLLRADDNTFGRKTRKILSVLAGEASAKFSLLMGSLAAFDARLSQLPSEALVVDYFRWRSEDAHRNALNAHCYWLLRSSGQTAQETAQNLRGLSVAEKNELLFQRGINFNDLPSWQKRGAAVYWEHYQKPALNPKTGKEVSAERHRLKQDLELPLGERYDDLIRGLLRKESAR
jgi:tRNA(His) guanylyltransferase